METAIILVCTGAVAALLWVEHRRNVGLKWIAKPTASAAFVALAFHAGAMESDYGRLILAGLCLCLVGDVLLIPKNERTFLAGMAAFALGHLAYISAFLVIWSGPSGLAFTAILAGILLIFFTVKWLWPHLGDFQLPVAAYCGIIGVMMAVSFMTAAPDGGAPYWLAVAGAVGFGLSDIAVARDQFVKPDFINKFWGLPLYYSAQLLLAASVSL